MTQPLGIAARRRFARGSECGGSGMDGIIYLVGLVVVVLAVLSFFGLR
jgi:hypothetical protein